MPVQTERPHLGLHCLKIRHLGVTQGGTAILEDVNLHIHCGGITAVIGRNGAGKSTLLKAILKEIPSTGTVEFSGHDGRSIPRLRIGYVPQSLALDPGSPATVLDMAQSLTSRWPAFLPPRKKDRERFRAHLARFNADSLLDRQLGRLSGGELQRVLLGVATLPKPDLLVLDEPVSGVDENGLEAFYATVDELRRKNHMAILLVSHDLDVVRRYADRVVLMQGTVIKQGSPEAVFGSPEFEHVFYARGGRL